MRRRRVQSRQSEARENKALRRAGEKKKKEAGAAEEGRRPIRGDEKRVGETNGETVRRERSRRRRHFEALVQLASRR